MLIPGTLNFCRRCDCAVTTQQTRLTPACAAQVTRSTSVHERWRQQPWRRVGSGPQKQPFPPRPYHVCAGLGRTGGARFQRRRYTFTLQRVRDSLRPSVVSCGAAVFCWPLLSAPNPAPSAKSTSSSGLQEGGSGQKTRPRLHIRVTQARLRSSQWRASKTCIAKYGRRGVVRQTHGRAGPLRERSSYRVSPWIDKLYL